LKTSLALLALVLSGSVHSAEAQSRPARPTIKPPRGFVSVNGTYQLTSNDFRDSATFHENVEDGQFGTDYRIKGGPAFDIAGGGTLWRNVGLGVAVSQRSHSTGATLTASIPHPFFFNRARSIDGAVNGLSRKESAVHVQVRGIFQVTRRLLVMGFGGPSFFQVTQGTVMDFSYSESYPYDSASFASAETTIAKRSKVGLNAGGDVAFFFSRQVGVGFTAQFAGTTVNIPSARGTTSNVKVGGIQAGGGLRLRF
jgi:hypothetical protein